MEEKINLKHLEKGTAGRIFETGIVDIGIGLIFIVSALAMIFDDFRYYIDILYILPVAFISLSVIYIANPRMGVVNFAKRRRRSNKALFAVLTTFLVVMVGLTFFGGADSASEVLNPRWIISGIIFFICVAIAYFMSFDRMYFYAFLFVGTFNLSEEIRENPGVITEGGYVDLLVALILITVGCVYLIKFLKKNPLPEKGVGYDG